VGAEVVEQLEEGILRRLRAQGLHRSFEFARERWQA